VENTGIMLGIAGSRKKVEGKANYAEMKENSDVLLMHKACQSQAVIQYGILSQEPVTT
jgi:hypothetical protein